MSKALLASCKANVVSVDGTALVGTEILSEGVGDSEGVLFLDEDKKVYVAKTSPDLKTTLDKLVEVLGKVKEGLTKASEALTKLDTAGFLNAAQAGVPSPPVAGSDISGITSAVGGIDSVVSALNTLKGNLK